MEELGLNIIDFFISPYQEATTFGIALEVIAACFGIMSVLFAKRESIWVYPTGIVSTIIYVYICFTVKYYGDFIINIYYTIMSVYGWILWARISHGETLKITWSSKRDWVITSIIVIATMLFVIAIYVYYDSFESWLNYVDVLTTGLAFGSMWLMAKKKVENWIGWVITDIISVPLYFAKGLGFTGIQYTIFLILAWQAYYIWKKDAEPRKISTE